MLHKKENHRISSQLLRFRNLIVLTIFFALSCQQSHESRKIMLESLKEPEVASSSGMAEESSPEMNTEEYDRIYENAFLEAAQNPLSTFSIDVDNASYSNIRRFINNNQLPPKDAIRIEEMINYFTYNYPQPVDEHPFYVYTEVGECPWSEGHYLAHIGIQGKKLNYEEIKPSNLVFLLDVSGSMDCREKLGLIKKSIKLLVEGLNKEDKVSIVVYAGAAGVVLPPTSAENKEEIFDALKALQAGGSTAGGEGIKLAYKVAKENLLSDGNNRVILCSDGDFNVGVSSTGELVRIIEEKRKDDIYLTICGFGMGNYKDGRMEQISNAGNGNYFYIDNINEAKKVFVTELRANMFTIAKDVKIQVEFNPQHVKSYRLIGYENRILAKEDFNDDLKDAGELGAGHTVTAIYEIVPQNAENNTKSVDDLKYQQTQLSKQAKSNNLFTLKLRYKPIKSDKSKVITRVVENNALKIQNTSSDFKFSASVAAFGMQLRESEFQGTINYDLIKRLAKASELSNENEQKLEFMTLVKSAELLSNTTEQE